MRIFKLAFAFVLAILFSCAAINTASAQTSAQFNAPNPFGAADNRYDGYPQNLPIPGSAKKVRVDIKWPLAAPTTETVAQCAASPFYEPSDLTLAGGAMFLKLAGEPRKLATEECRWMLVRGGWHLVHLPIGTFIGHDELNRELAYLGSTKGTLVCYNPTPFGIPVNVPVAAVAPVVAPAVPAPPVVVPAPAVIAPASAPVTPATAPYNPPTRDHGDAHFSGSIGHSNGKVHTDYLYPDPKGGDVPKKNSDSAWVVGIRFDQSSNHGVFGEATFDIASHAKGLLYQDLQGNWLTRKRDTEDDSDPEYKVAGGYKFALGRVGIGPRVDYNHVCLSEKYNAQNTDTDTKRCFQTLGIGAEVSGSTTSDQHKVTVRGDVSIGVQGHRSHVTSQVYHGPPAITFPTVTDEPQTAKLNRFSGEVEVGVVRHVSAFGNVSYSSWGSKRPGPASNPAVENTKMTKVVVGVKIGF